MTYEISQILNLEKSNAGITPHILGSCAMSVILEIWGNKLQLAEAYESGAMNLSEEAESVNAQLEEAGCETRVDEDDVIFGIKQWTEIETIAGNI